MIKIIKKLIKLTSLIIITLLFSFSASNSEVYEEIEVQGNERLSVETVIMFSGLNLSDDLTINDLNSSIKKLYKTNYFKDIKIIQKNKLLKIIIIENPIIQSIKLNGIRNKTLLSELQEVTKKNEKYPFLKNNIQNQNNLLLNIIRGAGYYFAELDTNVIENQNNSVDIIYNFILGERAIIKKINFQGDKVFSDSKLRNIIRSEEGRFWKFLTSNKYLDELKIKQDEKRLKQYYQSKGYYNVNIKSSYAKNINNEFFEINFNIDPGDKFFFNNISIEINDNFNKENFIEINKDLKKLNGEKYSSKIINKITDEIDQILLSKEFLFLNTKYDLSIIDENKINLKFKFEDLERFYVEQINVFGNFITEEKVIRNSLIVDEGDAFNKVLLDKSINSIKSRGIFRSVESKIKTSKTDNQKKVIDILVEEMPTGEVYAGAGTGTSGATFTAGVQEKNYLGKGIKLGTNILISEEEIKGKFSVVNPNFKNTNRSLNTTLESTSSDFLSTGGFKTSRTGFSLGTGFEQYSDLYVNLDLSA
ncbi:MAG: outer membrane protein assembly factor BamA, partial [Candidatus Pelagibacter sp.]